MKVTLTQTITIAITLDVDPSDKASVRKIRGAIADKDIYHLNPNPENVKHGFVAVDNMDFWAINPND